MYFVGPNVVALEQLHGFDPREFRLWLALHEVTHRCQFTGHPLAARLLPLPRRGRASARSSPTRRAWPRPSAG